MADSNLPKQDFAPPWLKFPSETTKTSNQKSSSHQNDRNRQRRDEPYYPRADFGRLHRQNSFDFPDGKRYPQSQNKYRHHSVDDDYYGYSYGYGGYYPPSHSYEKLAMQYSSQPSLTRNMGRDGKYSASRFNQMNGCITTNGPHQDLFEPYYQQSSAKRNFYDRDHHRDSKNNEAKEKERGSDKDRHYSDDFPSLNGSGDSLAESKPTKPGSGVWDNPPKSNRNDESSDLLKNSAPGIYKALVPSKNGQNKKNGKDGPRMNGNARDLSPLSPSSKLNHKEATRQSPTPDLTIVTQPKKLGDKKSDFLRALRNESSVRNGELFHNINQNNQEKKQDTKREEDSPMSEDNDSFHHMNGDSHLDSNKNLLNGKAEDLINGDGILNGESLINDVDHISLSGEEEEKRLLLSMGWVEEDNTEYVITEDEIREFQKLHGLKSSLGTAINRKLVSNGMLNGIPSEDEEIDNNKHL